MLLAAKTVAPASVAFALWHELVEEACANGSTAITTPPGALLPEALAGILRALRGEPLWVTLGPEDADPAVLLYSMLLAAQRLNPALGSTTSAALTQYAGLADDWPTIFRAFADDLAHNLPDGCVLVLDHVEQLDTAGATFGLLSTYILPYLTDAHPWLIITTQAALRSGLPPATRRINTAELRLSPPGIAELAAALGCTLPNNALRRAGTLLGGQADSLYSFFQMAGRLGAATAAPLIDRASGADQLLLRIARTVYGMDSPSEHAALDFSRRLGYTHADLRGADLAQCTPNSAWLLPLADGWQRLRDVWQTILPRLLRPGEQVSTAALHSAAERLVQQGALIPAVELYQELGAHDQAAAVISTALDRMMHLGQWRTIDRWLERMPAAVLHAWPWLTYVQGEIAAAQHDFPQARRSFATATNSFSLHNDTVGACQSLMAESTLARWAGDAQQAGRHTLEAARNAEAAGLAWQLGWAAWQLVELALNDGNLAHAMVYLERALRAASAGDEQLLATLLGQVETLLSRGRMLWERREQHRQAYVALEQAEQTLHERVRHLIAAPQSLDEQVLSLRPWTATPLMLKLTAPSLAQSVAASPRLGLWNGLLRAFGLARPEPVQAPPAPPAGLPAEPVSLFSFAAEHMPALTAPRSDAQPHLDVVPPAAPAAPPTLIAHLLGPFRISLNDDPVVNWPSGRGRALLKYLLVQHTRPTPRDVLMELLWPEADPDDARNSLNVAMHGLRQAFRSITDRPIVLFQREDTTYRLNPELTIWLDVVEFERHIAAGRRAEEESLFADAVASYEQAASLYQGDFMAEDPYEDWPMLRREQLRLAYLDALERLGQIYFSQGQYGACATLCQHILARDNCREDAHCRLMRCYSRQGQHHLALRQYQACVKALSDELGVEPLAATVRLADQIRRHEYV